MGTKDVGGARSQGEANLGRPSTGDGSRQRPGSGKPGARPGTAQRQSLPTFKATAQLSERSAAPGASAIEEVTEMGYNKVSRGGLQAMRVPIENFAGLFESTATSGSISGVAPLQLIVDAVVSTGNYAVFNSPLIRIILEFKWYGFARNAFYREVTFSVVHVAIVQLYNVYSASTLNYTLKDCLGASDSDFPGRPDYIMIIGFVWTTLMCLYNLSVEIRQMRAGFLNYIGDTYNYVDWIYILGQGSINVLFVLRDFVPDALLYTIPNATEVAEGGRRLGEELLDQLLVEPRLPHYQPHYQHSFGGGMGFGAGEAEYDALGHGFRNLKAKSGNAGADVEVGETGYQAGAFVLLQSIVVVTSTLRLLYFFRGLLRLGALTHTLYRIIIDILPLITLLIVFILGFTGAMMVLIMQELDPGAGREYQTWHSFVDVMYVVVNIGLYTYYDPLALKIGRHVLILIMYMCFMLLVQIILLNMLIAIMAESFSRVSAQAELVAQKGRAQLILEYEQAVISQYKQKAKSRRGAANKGDILDHAAPHGSGGLFQSLSESDVERLERVCPRWLHVLMPAEHARGEEEDTRDEVKELRQLKRQLALAEESLSARQGKLLEAVGKRDEVAERQKMLQAIRVELSQFKEEIVADVRGR